MLGSDNPGDQASARRRRRLRHPARPDQGLGLPDHQGTSATTPKSSTATSARTARSVWRAASMRSGRMAASSTRRRSAKQRRPGSRRRTPGLAFRRDLAHPLGSGDDDYMAASRHCRAQRARQSRFPATIRSFRGHALPGRAGCPRSSLFFVLVVNNAVVNLRAQNKTIGFDFLWLTRPVSTSASQLIPYRPRRRSISRRSSSDCTNTLLVAVIGIFFATDHRLRRRHRAAIEQLARSARSRRSMSRLSATSRCCCSCSSGTSRVLKAMPAVKQSYRLPFGDVLPQSARPLSCRGRLPSDAVHLGLCRARRRASSARSVYRGWAKRGSRRRASASGFAAVVADPHRRAGARLS